MKKTAVILVHLGTPTHCNIKSIRSFLKKFLSDRRVIELPKWIWWPILHGIILRIRPKKLSAQYQKIWQPQGSPLHVISLLQAQALQTRLALKNPRIQVVSASCYGENTIPEVAEMLRQKKIMDWRILPLYPQYSATTTAAALDQFWKLLLKWRDIPAIRYVKEYAAHPLYIQALVESIQSAWQASGKQLLLFSFHGLPLRNVQLGDPYPKACYQTAHLCAEALGLEEGDYRVSFQSRFGYAAWLSPATTNTLITLAKEGIHNVSVICPGFAADCLETLEEIAIENQKVFLNHGGKSYTYIPALNASEKHVELLEALVSSL